MSEGTSTEIFTQEIADLEAKLAAKKQELVLAGKETPEKHLFKEVVKDHAFASEGFAATTSTTGTSSASVAPNVGAQTQTVLDTLVAQAFTSGIAAAVASARKMENPYLLELLHDRLVDAYYAKLLQARKIKPI